MSNLFSTKRPTGKDYKNLAKDFDSLEGKLPEDCKDKRTQCFERSIELGFVVGKNDNAIEIHDKSYFGYGPETLCVQLVLDKEGKIIVNSDRLWKMAETTEMRELGLDR